MDIQQQIYWQTTTQMPGASNLSTLPGQVDVAIIGGGYTGLSAARTLARQGAKVAVLEAETIGWGASSRNGGQVLTGLKVGPLDLIQEFGRERARALFEAGMYTGGLGCL